MRNNETAPFFLGAAVFLPPWVQAKVSGTVAVMVTGGAGETGQVGIDS